MGTELTNRALIFGAAPCTCWAFLRPYLERWLPCPVLCADGGSVNAASAGLKADFLIGDWDSGGSPSNRIPCVTLPAEKDLTDLEAAVDHASAMGARNLLLCGCTGGRLDHTTSNLMLLEHVAEQGCQALLIDSDNEVRLLEGETIVLENFPSYRYLSLIPLDRQITGVTLRGVKYPLTGARLKRGSTFSVSNEPASDCITITVETGRVLLIRSQRTDV